MFLKHIPKNSFDQSLYQAITKQTRWLGIDAKSSSHQVKKIDFSDQSQPVSTLFLV